MCIKMKEEEDDSNVVFSDDVTFRLSGISIEFGTVLHPTNIQNERGTGVPKRRALVSTDVISSFPLQKKTLKA